MRKVGLTGLALIILFWTATACIPGILRAVGHPQRIEALGAWGSIFGAFSALFSALYFGAVVITLFLQQRQNRDTRNDQHKQRFDSSYFELLRLLRETRTAVSFRFSDEYVSEKEAEQVSKRSTAAFRTAWDEAAFWIDKEEPNNSAHLGTLYEVHLHKRYESNLAPYFRVMYTILHRIQSDKVLTNEDKVEYGNLLRSQLNSYELAVAALNGLAPFSGRFAELLTEFHMLKYLPEGQRRQTFMRFYPPKAFEARD